VGADLAAFAGFHYGLEEAPENGGGDARPIEGGASEKLPTHYARESGEREALGVEVPLM